MRHLQGAPLDRLDTRRGADDALGPGTRVITFDASITSILLTGGPEPCLAFDALEALGPAPGDPLVLLGEHEGARWAARTTNDAPEDGVGRWYEGVRAAASALPAREAGLVVYGAGLLGWHRRARFCGSCGGGSRAVRSGHQRVCEGCGGVEFPRTDPAVITLLRRGERCLLVNQPGWPEDRFAAVAGFVEPGETLEAAVAREVDEEVGLAVEAVEYLGSQPWPFPHSLMIGFRTTAAEGELRLGEEIRAARWFTRAELRAAVKAGEITIPTPFSISRSLIDDWLGER